jgi:hypothetical protein
VRYLLSGGAKKLARRITHHGDLYRILLHDCTRPIDPGSISIHASSSPRLEAHWRVSVVRGELTAGRKNNASTTFLFGSRHVISSYRSKAKKSFIYGSFLRCSIPSGNSGVTESSICQPGANNQSWSTVRNTFQLRGQRFTSSEPAAPRRPSRRSRSFARELTLPVVSPPAVSPILYTTRANTQKPQ